MSSKKQKAKAVKAVPVMPAGKMPVAMVKARHLDGMVTRRGRGFSMAELEGGKVPADIARKWGLSVDPLRGSALESNVKALEKWYAPVAKAAAERPKAPEPEPEEEKPKEEKPKKPAKKPAAKKKKKSE